MDTKMGFEKVGDLQMRFSKWVKAPRALVWKAHTEPALLAQWWGPQGFSITTHSIDLRTGGTWKLTMHAPDGTDYPNMMWYKEVKEPVLMDYDHGDFEAPHFHVRTELIEEGGGTSIVTVMSFKDKASRDQTAEFALPGHTSTMERLEALMAKEQA